MGGGTEGAEIARCGNQGWKTCRQGWKEVHQGREAEKQSQETDLIGLRQYWYQLGFTHALATVELLQLIIKEASSLVPPVTETHTCNQRKLGCHGRCAKSHCSCVSSVIQKLLV